MSTQNSTKDEEEFVAWTVWSTDGGKITYDPNYPGEIICRNENCTHYRLRLSQEVCHCDIRMAMITDMIMDFHLNGIKTMQCPRHSSLKENYIEMTSEW